MRLSGSLVAAVSLALSLLAVAVAPTSAQVTWRTMGLELDDMPADVGAVWRSPLHAGHQAWAVAGLVGVGFAAMLVVDDRVDGWIVRHPRSMLVRSVGPFREAHREIARIPTARRIIPMSFALVAAGALTESRNLREAGFGCISAWAVSNTVRYAIYPVIARARPSASEGDQYKFAVPGRGWNWQSFFAGHGANMVACTAFWNTRFDLGVGEPLLYVLAAEFSLARMADRRHWASDTFVGVVVGYAIGRAIAGRYDQRLTRRRARPASETRALREWPILLWQQRF